MNSRAQSGYIWTMVTLVTQRTVTEMYSKATG